MLAGELPPVSRRPNLGYPWVRVDERNTMVPRLSPETSPSMSFSPVSAVLCSCVADGWDPLTYGPPLSIVVGALDRVHLAAELDLKFDFLYLLF